jgi:hypothetical protein
MNKPIPSIGKRAKIEPTDLRGITRQSKSRLTIVSINLGYDEKGYQQKIDWLKFGSASLLRGNPDKNRWDLKAYLSDGAKDFEHSSAYALILPLVGVTFEMVTDHMLHLNAWVDPCLTLGNFHVPRPGYNPLEDLSTKMCKTCEKRHPIVENYIPPFDIDLYRAVAGRPVEIVIGPVYE